jgi:isoleucyl-tRNA synthetase
LAKFPTQEAERQDAALEARMAAAQTLASLTLSLRKKADLRVRQPLSRILVPVKTPAQQAELQKIAPIVLTETNVKTIEFIVGTQATRGLVTKSAKANFKVLGARLGKRMKDVAAAVLLLSQDDIAVLEESEQFTLTLPDESTESIHLHEVEILAEDLPGWQVASEGGLTVALDTSLTQELKNEGFARDLVNRIQRLRKESGYAITDRIALELEATPEVIETYETFQTYIREEILAERLVLVDRASLEAADNQSETKRGELHWLDVEEVQVGARIQRIIFAQPS